MRVPKVVIGLGYGDEGKGRTVDYLASEYPDSVVVRFSGGQQAGHTVMTGEYKHIFSNVGSGTFRGCPTYFSEHTCIYPPTMFNELDVLSDAGVFPKIVIHPLANLTTPYDVILNRKDRKNLEDGTCGLGIGKTMQRQNDSPFKLYAVDLLNPLYLAEKLQNLAEYYGIHYDDYEEEFTKYLEAAVNIEWDIQGYDYLYNKNLIFEGSQGVLLDMDHGMYPNVTYSNTTSKNAIEICKTLGYGAVHIYGVTRSYHTRHGNGSFTETPLNLVNNQEETCLENEYQGKLRVGMLDKTLLKHAIEIDKIYSGELTRIFTLVVTCLDQHNEDFKEFEDPYEVLRFSSPKN